MRKGRKVRGDGRRGETGEEVLRRQFELDRPATFGEWLARWADEEIASAPVRRGEARCLRDGV